MNDLAMILAAAQFAADKHSGQTRKNGEPYINHPIEVACLVASVGDVRDPGVIAAALLHDVVEDCGVRPEDLAREFNPFVAELVALLSDDKSLPEDERRRQQTLATASLPKEAKIIRLADKISNLNELIAMPADSRGTRLQKYVDWVDQLLPLLRGASEPLESMLAAALQNARHKINNG